MNERGEAKRAKEDRNERYSARAGLFVQHMAYGILGRLVSSSRGGINHHHHFSFYFVKEKKRNNFTLITFSLSFF